MKFDARAVTPGFAKTCQNGTEPSAKSSHAGLPEMTLQFACSRSAGAVPPPRSASARTATATTPSLFTGKRLAREPVAFTNALRFTGAPLALGREALEARFGDRGGRGPSRSHRGDRSRLEQQFAAGAQRRPDVGERGADLRGEMRRVPHPRRDRAVLPVVGEVGESACERDPRDDEARPHAAVDAGPRLPGVPRPVAPDPDSVREAIDRALGGRGSSYWIRSLAEAGRHGEQGSRDDDDADAVPPVHAE